MKPSLPPVTRNAADSAQRLRLLRWIEEWELDRVLREDGERGEPHPPARGVEGGDAGDAELAPGGVRLLPPSLPGAGTRPIFVLVVKADGPKAFRVAPFGRFAEPALPGEWLTGRTEPGLRVLCLWNAIRMTRATLLRTWHVGSLPARQLASAAAVFAHATQGARLPKRLKGATGPPLRHPFDVRHVYVREEAARMKALDEPAISRGKRGLYPMPDEERELPKAAEDREPYG